MLAKEMDCVQRDEGEGKGGEVVRWGGLEGGKVMRWGGEGVEQIKTSAVGGRRALGRFRVVRRLRSWRRRGFRSWVPSASLSLRGLLLGRFS